MGWYALALTLSISIAYECQGFESHDYTDTLLESYFSAGGDAVAEAYIFDSEVQRAISIQLNGNSEGSNRVVTRLALERATYSATLSFRVFFPHDFQWVKGGKLLGLGPVHPVTNGGLVTTDKWSARIMFRDRGRVSTYMYCFNKSTKWGRSKFSHFPLLYRGGWNEISFALNLFWGPIGSSSTLTVNGFSVYDSGLIFPFNNDGSRGLINTLLFDVFYGGNSSEWAPSTPEGLFSSSNIIVDDVVVVIE